MQTISSSHLDLIIDLGAWFDKIHKEPRIKKVGEAYIQEE